MSNKVEFDVSANTAGVERPMKKATAATKELKKVVAQVEEIDVGGALAASFRKTSMEVAKATQNMKKLAREEAALARSQRAKTGGLGGMMAGVGGSVAARMAPLAVAGAAVAGAGAMGKAASDEQTVVQTLHAANKDGAERLAGLNRQLGVQYGVSAIELHKQAARLSQAGFTTEQVAQVIKANVVAARGDVARLEGLMDELVEAGTRGYLEESVLSAYDKAGVGLRTEMMKRMDMGKEQLESAMSAGKVSVERYFEVIGRVTGEGSTSLEMARAAAESSMGAWERLKETGQQTMAAMGESLVSMAKGPLNWAVNKLQAVVGYMRPELSGYLTYEKTGAELEEDRRAALATEAAERVRAQREALVATLKDEADAWRKLNSEARAARESEARAGESLGARRERVLAAVGLPSTASAADIDAALAADAGYEASRQASRAVRLNERVAALVARGAAFGLTEKATRADEDRAMMAYDGMGDWLGERRALAEALGVQGGTLADMQSAAAAGLRAVEPGDLSRAQALVAARKEMAAIARLEKTAAEQAQKEAEAREKEAAAREKSMAALARRRELQEAQLRGDEKAVELLRLQEEGLKLMAEYRAAGASAEEALGYASQEMQQRLMAADAEAARNGGEGATSKGWLRTSLQEVGGAAHTGARLYDAAAVTAARDTQKNTGKSAEFLNKIFAFMQRHAIPAVLD